MQSTIKCASRSAISFRMQSLGRESFSERLEPMCAVVNIVHVLNEDCDETIYSNIQGGLEGGFKGGFKGSLKGVLKGGLKET